MPDRDPIAEALQDLRKKEANVRGIVDSEREGMKRLTMDMAMLESSRLIFRSWPPSPVDAAQHLRAVLTDCQVDYPREDLCPAREMRHFSSHDSGLLPYAVFEPRKPLEVDFVISLLENAGYVPMDVAGLCRIADHLGTTGLQSSILLGLGTTNQAGYFAEISREVVIPSGQKRNTLYFGEFNFVLTKSRELPTIPRYLIPAYKK